MWEAALARLRGRVARGDNWRFKRGHSRPCVLKGGPVILSGQWRKPLKSFKKLGEGDGVV